MNSEQKQMRSFKVKSESGEVRRFRIPTEGEKYAELSKIVMSLFDTNSFKLCYTDDEGDRIVIESSCELDVALHLMPDLVSLNIIIISEKEEGPVRGRRCGAGRGGRGAGRGGGRGRGAFHHGGNGRRGACGSFRGGQGKELWAEKVKERLDAVNSKIAAIEERLCVGEEGVMLLWKKKNLECKKSFLMDRLKALEQKEEEKEEERGEGEGERSGKLMFEVFEGRYNMVCLKLQILGEFLATEEGSQHEGLLSKKQKFEKNKSRMEERRANMEERRAGMTERRASMKERRANMGERKRMGRRDRMGEGKCMRECMGEKRGGDPQQWLKRVEAKLEKMREKETQDGFKAGDGFVWRQQKLEQKRLLLQAMLKEESA